MEIVCKACSSSNEKKLDEMIESTTISITIRQCIWLVSGSEDLKKMILGFLGDCTKEVQHWNASSDAIVLASPGCQRLPTVTIMLLGCINLNSEVL